MMNESYGWLLTYRDEGGSLGNDLFSKVTGLTGLPEDQIGRELRNLLEKKGISPEECTMDSLRSALQDYLNDLNDQMIREGAFDVGESTEDTDSCGRKLESTDSDSDELTQ